MKLEKMIKLQDEEMARKDMAVSLSEGMINAAQNSVKVKDETIKCLHNEITVLKQTVEKTEAQLKELRIETPNKNTCLESPDVTGANEYTNKPRKKKRPLLDVSYDMNSSFFNEMGDIALNKSTPVRRKRKPSQINLLASLSNSANKKNASKRKLQLHSKPQSVDLFGEDEYDFFV